jgi:hypothetical protein
LWSAYFTSGFRGAHRDAALREVVQPPISSEQQHDERDPDPCPPVDEECFEAPDAASVEEAISKFVEGLESQERSWFDGIHRLLKGLPVPVTKAIHLRTHGVACSGWHKMVYWQENRDLEPGIGWGKHTLSTDALPRHFTDLKWCHENVWYRIRCRIRCRIRYKYRIFLKTVFGLKFRVLGFGFWVFLLGFRVLRKIRCFSRKIRYRYQVQLKKLIVLVRNPDFDSKEVYPDLHKWMEKAVLDASRWSNQVLNMREGPEDGDQDLNLWARELQDVVREIMEDPIFKGNQKYSFELDLDEAGKRLYGGEANAGVVFQIGQIKYIIQYLWYCLVYQIYTIIFKNIIQYHWYIMIYVSIYKVYTITY